MQSTMGLVRRGWSRDSLAVGDVITIRANPDKNPDRKLLFGMTYTKADGSTLSSQGQARGPAHADAAERVHDAPDRAE